MIGYLNIYFNKKKIYYLVDVLGELLYDIFSYCVSELSVGYIYNYIIRGLV